MVEGDIFVSCFFFFSVIKIAVFWTFYSNVIYFLSHRVAIQTTGRIIGLVTDYWENHRIGGVYIFPILFQVLIIPQVQHCDHIELRYCCKRWTVILNRALSQFTDGVSLQVVVGMNSENDVLLLERLDSHSVRCPECCRRGG